MKIKYKSTIFALLTIMSVKTANAADPVVSDVQSITLVDNRPPAELKKHRYAYMIFSCDFGILALGDNGGAGQRIQLLQADLDRLLAGHPHPQKITIDHYLIVLNSGSQLTADSVSVGMASQGFFGVPTDNRPEAKCSKEKMKIGWFSPDELTSPYSPLIAYIDADVDGRAINVRAVYSPPKPLDHDYNFDRPEAVEVIHAAFSKANGLLADEILKAQAN